MCQIKNNCAMYNTTGGNKMDILPNFLNLWSKIHSEKLNWSAFIAHMDKQSFYQSSPKQHHNDMYKRTDLSVSDGQNNWQTSVNNMKFVN